jgi:hypothetical protein
VLLCSTSNADLIFRFSYAVLRFTNSTASLRSTSCAVLSASQPRCRPPLYSTAYSLPHRLPCSRLPCRLPCSTAHCRTVLYIAVQIAVYIAVQNCGTVLCKGSPLTRRCACSTCLPPHAAPADAEPVRPMQNLPTQNLPECAYAEHSLPYTRLCRTYMYVFFHVSCT